MIENSKLTSQYTCCQTWIASTGRPETSPSRSSSPRRGTREASRPCPCRRRRRRNHSFCCRVGDSTRARRRGSWTPSGRGGCASPCAARPWRGCQARGTWTRGRASRPRSWARAGCAAATASRASSLGPAGRPRAWVWNKQGKKKSFSEFQDNKIFFEQTRGFFSNDGCKILD